MPQQIEALIASWREKADTARQYAKDAEGESDGANAHAFRKEARVRTEQANDLSALLAALPASPQEEHEDDHARVDTPGSSVDSFTASENKPIRDTSKADAVYRIACDLLPALRNIARENGYALAYHGSFARDIDVIAVPWLDKAVGAVELAEAIRSEAERKTGKHCLVLNDEKAQPLDYIRRSPEPKAHGRLGWSIQIIGWNCYIDLSVIPAGQAHIDARIAELGRLLDQSNAAIIREHKRAKEAEDKLAAALPDAPHDAQARK